MTIRINSNILSLNAQRRFGEATNTLSESFNRLSSGLRINKASDDAAGLSISSLLNADKRVTTVGIRNINDGISYLNVAESALSELSNIVIRISELAEQSANGTFGNDQRKALQQEVTSLENEYNRIIKTTSFNGNQLLTGSTTNTVLQGGYGVQGQLITQVGDSSLGIANDLMRAGLTTRIDTDSLGNVSNGISAPIAISSDGRYIAFYSDASNLVAGDTNGVKDAFIKDTLRGETKRVSTSSSGIEGDGSSSVSAISGDGRYVFFHSSASQLVSGDTNGSSDAFRKDMLTGETIRISTASDGSEGNSNSGINAVSADGRYIAINSIATNLVPGDTNGVQDAFIKDLSTGEITRISTDSAGIQGNNNSEIYSISADNRYVVFSSTATNLVSNDTNGAPDVFIKDLSTGETTRVSTNSSGVEGDNDSKNAAISADGRFVGFTSTASNLVDGDTGGMQDVFVKEILTGQVRRISTDINGVQGNGHSTFASISADGRYIAYYSDSTNLVEGDTNGHRDGFIHDSLTGETKKISLDNSGGQSALDSYATGLSADGRYALFYDVSGANYVRDLSNAGVQEISGMVVSNQASARITLDLSKKYQSELSRYQAGIGASLSRAATFVNTLQVQSENYSAAASQITDVDVAEESSKLLANKIIQQVASSVLSQANQQPALILRLLSGVS